MSIPRLPSIAIALPGVTVAALALCSFVLAIAGAHPLWKANDVNMSEAAALRDRATVIRLIRNGEDPDERRPVRAGLVSTGRTMLTPIEAAMAARRPEVVEVLLWAANELDGPAWIRARCLAAMVPDAEIERVVDRYRPAGIGAGDSVDCVGIERPW